uniref:Uncharacterized protein n=1 Tax=Siphoviridae sp. ctTIi48 TaxID=2827875 RepID=A0A8S5TM37_9CAUD|nr:MAG TPA: hypothetical protein [Siphoviridae sp. ctTIi48]
MHSITLLRCKKPRSYAEFKILCPVTSTNRGVFETRPYLFLKG